MNELFNGLEYVRAYVDDSLINGNNDFEDYVNKGKIWHLTQLVSKSMQKNRFSPEIT